MKRLEIAGGLLLASALLAGCTTAQPSGADTAPAVSRTAPAAGASGEPEPAITSAGEYRPLPLDAYRFSPEQHRLYWQAVRLLRDECLATFGFQPYPDPPVFTGTEKYLRGSVTLDGYGITPTAEDLAFDKAERDYAEAYDKNPPSAAYQLVDQGTVKRSGIDPGTKGSTKTVHGKQVHPTGCTGWAQDQISTKDRSEGSPRQLKPIYEAAWAAYAADPALARLNKAWSACMKTQGYKFADPHAAQDAAVTPAAEGAAAPPEEKPAAEKAAAAPGAQSAGDTGSTEQQEPRHTDAERAIARADLACRAETSYDDALYELQARHQRTLIEANAELLTRLQRDLADELRQAAKVIAGKD